MAGTKLTGLSGRLSRAARGSDGQRRWHDLQRRHSHLAVVVRAANLSLSGASLAGGASCTVTLDGVVVHCEHLSYTTGVASVTGPSAVTARDSDIRDAADGQLAAAPTIAGRVSPSSITTSGTATLTLTITNPERQHSD